MNFPEDTWPNARMAKNVVAPVEESNLAATTSFLGLSNLTSSFKIKFAPVADENSVPLLAIG